MENYFKELKAELARTEKSQIVAWDDTVPRVNLSGRSEMERVVSTAVTWPSSATTSVVASEVFSTTEPSINSELVDWLHQEVGKLTSTVAPTADDHGAGKMEDFSFMGLVLEGVTAEWLIAVGVWAILLLLSVQLFAKGM
jgi:hypothetical protein